MSTSQQLPAAGESLAPDVQRFCAEHDLAPHVQDALRLAQAVFQPVAPMTIELNVNPETVEEWLIILVPVAGSPAEVVRRQVEFTPRWIDTAPQAAREKIRVLFDIVAC
jgi:hypothetical protein